MVGFGKGKKCEEVSIEKRVEGRVGGCIIGLGHS